METPITLPGKLFKGSILNGLVPVSPFPLPLFSCLDCECDVWSFSSYSLTMSQI